MPAPSAIFAASLVVLLCILVVWLSRGGGWSLADRIAANGWELYTYPGCGACTAQLKYLNNGMLYRPSYVCGTGALGAREARCAGAYPAWHNVKTGATRTGVQRAPALEEMAR